MFLSVSKKNICNISINLANTVPDDNPAYFSIRFYMKKLNIPSLITLILYGLPHISIAQIQPTLPPSPTASAIGRHIDNPVSHYTGTPDITIPLYEINLKNLTVPINLKYNPQDIQVATIPSNVGLGWSLNAGGVITRAVKDIPDDEHHDYCNGSENYDTRWDMSMSGEYPYCNWGYLYAIAESHPTDPNMPGILYQNTPTYNLDLDAIYANRSTTSPERAIIYNFGNSFWGILNGINLEFDNQLSTYRLVGGHISTEIRFFADLEPDIFYYNFPGYSGKFVFDVENGSPKIRTIPYQDLAFTYETSPSTRKLTAFTVTDPNGNRYRFDQIETTKSESTDFWYWQQRIYNSAWWLSTIVTPYGDTLNFTYENETIDNESTNIMNPNWEAMIDANQNNDPSALNVLKHIRYVNNTKRLREIYTNDTRLVFDATHNRQDLGGESNAKAITSLTVHYINQHHNISSRIKKINLGYGYFHGHDASKRLRLQTIQEFGESDLTFVPYYTLGYSYYDQEPSSSSWKKFPKRDSYDTDLWGYYNGAGNVTPVPSHHIYPENYPQGDLRMYSIYEKSSYTGRHFTTVGGNRQPNADYMTIGVLNKITYPSGGTTSYQFEPHSFILDGEEEIGGGLRIAAIVKDNGQGESITHRYRYTKSVTNSTSSGKIVSLPMYVGLSNSLALDNPTTSIAPELALKTQYGVFSYSVSELGRTTGSNVGYTNVIEYISASANLYPDGRTEYIFSFPAAFGEMNDTEGVGCSLAENGICEGLYQTTRVHNFFMYGDNRNDAYLNYYPESSLSHLTPPNPNYDWNRGLLLKKKYYDATSQLVAEESHSYQNYYPNGQTTPRKVYGIKMGDFNPWADFNNDGNNDTYGRRYPFRVAKYEVLTEVAKVPASVTTTRYDQGNPAKSISTTTWYTYGSTRVKKLTEKRTEQSDGSQLVSKYKYAADYFPSSPPPDEGVSIPLIRQMKGILVEEAQFTRSGGTDRLIGGQLSTYHEYISLPVLYGRYTLQTASPQSSYTASEYQGPVFSFNSRYQRDLLCRRYDSQGNLLEASTPDDTRICYVWGYQGRYPVAKVINATYNEIEALLTSADFSYLMNGAMVEIFGPGYPPEYMHTPQDIRLIINKLRTGLPNAQVYTYTYEPLIGLRSETSPAGITTSYEYDSMGRLQVIKDHDGNIVEMLDYFYKGHD